MRTALGLAIAVACALAPSSASAGIAYVHYAFGQTTIEYHAKAGERNTVDAHWQLDGRWVDIYDNSATITTEQTNVTLPGIPDPDVSPSQEEFRPCVLVNEHHAHCMLSTPPENSDYWQGWAQPPSALRNELGDRAGSFGPSWGTDPYWAFVYGDEGNDSITLGRGLDGGHSSWGYGGPGDDSLTAPDGAT